MKCEFLAFLSLPWFLLFYHLSSFAVYDLSLLMILQQVSNLLAVMFVVSSLSEQFSMPSFSKVFEENYWSSYFHQASIGTHLTYQFLSHLTGRCKVESLVDVEAYLSCLSILWNFIHGFYYKLQPLKLNVGNISEYYLKMLSSVQTLTCFYRLRLIPNMPD
jgi:hypothetical protein